MKLDDTRSIAIDKIIEQRKSRDAKGSARQHYYLVTGEIIFQPGENLPLNAIRLNAVAMTPDQKFPVHQIGRAQQALQMQFMQKIENDPEVKIDNVVIMGLTYLGQFTPEEFQAPAPTSG